jgi:hypothetical protein
MYPRPTFAGAIVYGGLFFQALCISLVKHLRIFVRYDATSRAGLTALKKCIAALHQLDYDMVADTIDKYLKLGKQPP